MKQGSRGKWMMQGLVALVALGAGAAQATLFDRGGGLVYDDVLNITWLGDANYAKTSHYDADGLMSWTAANTWADNLVYHDSVRNVDYSDWRLPTLNPSDTTCSGNFDPGGGFPLQYYGFNCTGGELSHLLVADLGNKAGESVLTITGDTVDQIANQAFFANLESYVYWSGTAYAPLPTRYAWGFSSNFGYLSSSSQNYEFYAWAVRPGDVAAAQGGSTVPEPGSLLLAGLGLGALGWMRRRRGLGA